MKSSEIRQCAPCGSEAMSKSVKYDNLVEMPSRFGQSYRQELQKSRDVILFGLWPSENL